MSSEDYGCYSAPDRRGCLQRLTRKMFPARHCVAPDAPGEFSDCIHGRAVTCFGLLDRLRVLLTGVVVTEVVIATEHSVGATVTAAECYVGTSTDIISQG